MTNLTRREHRQQAIWRAKEAYALWIQRGIKAKGFEPSAKLFGRPSSLCRYSWQGWDIWLNSRGKLTLATYDDQHTEE